MTRTAERPCRVFIVAGEVSGDRLGGRLMAALSERLPGEITFEGVGGPAMAGQGLVSRFPMEEISLHGLTQILTRIPQLRRRIRETAEAAVAYRPDVVVLVDVPGFNLRVAKAVRRRAADLPIVEYVSPTVWAYAPWRARGMARSIDRVMGILPFEPDVLKRLGGPPCDYVGHPLIEQLDELRPAPGERGPLPEGGGNLLLLPGSRRSEIDRLLPTFGEALALIAERQPGVSAFLPTPPHLAPLAREGVADWAVKPKIVEGDEAKLAAFRSAHAALAASGTVSLELALAGVPMVIAYRVDPLVRVLKPFLTAHSIVLANLVLGRNVIPEFLDGAASPHRLADETAKLLREGPERAAQLAAFAEIDREMALADETPSEAAARIVAEMSGCAARGGAARDSDV